MPTVYVESCPKARPEGSAIDDYILEFADDKPVGGQSYNAEGAHRRRKGRRPQAVGLARAPDRQGQA